MAVDRVRLLDENTANRIAAGEVVERPASVVKELVENAIDAEATHISIEIADGGREAIVVSDNGCGMTRNDAILALQRHATSKIRSADDLFAIQSLGFRGEALPSIASVSLLELTTKPKDEEVGVRIEVKGGEIVSVEEAAVRDGTTVNVRHLFFNTPARLHFLKSVPTELARALDVVGQHAIAQPHIAFRVRSDDHEVFSTPGTGETLPALAAVWGRDITKKLIPLEYVGTSVKVTGFVATPDCTRPGRSHELFFVNRRPVKSRIIGHALEEAMRTLTPESRFPIAAIFIELDPSLVDVNVHPTKAEVKFRREGEVHHAVSQSVKGALKAYGIKPHPRISVPPQTGPQAFGKSLFGNFSFLPSESREAVAQGGRSQQADENDPFASIPFGNEKDGAGVEEAFVPQLPERPKPFAEQLREFRVLGQYVNTYIIAATPDGIAIVDQHVAHERVLYERLTVQHKSEGMPMQRLEPPLTLQLGRREALLLAEHYRSFASAGWEIEPFGRESFVVRAIPALLARKPYEQILRDMIDELVNQSISKRLLVQQDHVTITNACKMAVKAGDPLTMEEMTALLNQLAETENPYLCPHGRPIIVMVTLREIETQFKRA
ncbi:DNA mismatch repair protein MutL [Chthonomonas calidirosea]|uniref:DNA mismatch repair endonuclease MutL n=1 Tax=Chthonomonas calidirosea TaxID=454171 RepID=UPI0006DD4EB4|nr:DNA mismatch repair endonuclease MutL [Chthonomonas calidirosea]CEK14064.1 DNA mismatch repair protein MutL [Chthonomonas calidirosea]CEK14068.1 DNA mismatch repair protein MutL [Chthonomonas calidirosea]